jgi:conjugal transfer mating pair stabilization protein TraG
MSYVSVNLYCYGSGSQVQGILNGVAAIIKPGTAYFQYISIAFLLAFILGVIHYTQTRKVSALVYTILRYTVITAVLLSPIYKVHIIDEINPGETYSVDGVPLGLAVPASLSSTFFHGLTKLVETAFHMPDDLNYTKSGFLFASNLMHKAPSIQAINAQDRENLKSYVEQCVFYDIHHGKYSKSDLLNSDDIWGLVSKKPSPIRAFMLDSEIQTCKDGTILLEARLKEIAKESGIKYAKAIFPGLKSKTDEALKIELLSYLGSSYTHLTGISKDGSEIMQQMIVMNAIKDATLCTLFNGQNL